jgi:16S rRNA (cytosine1402-N4)-methyltransferase
VENQLTEHIPVLAKTLSEQINLLPDAVMVDATIGHGGHSLLFGKNLSPKGTIIGLDVDPNSLAVAEQTLKDLPCKVILCRENFSLIGKVLKEHNIEKVDFILADLGICSAQLTDVDTGLSFQTNMPLDMRIDKRLNTTAADIVNSTDEKSLANLIFEFGQDRASRRIAKFIVHHRRNQKITTTAQLSDIVCRALGIPAKNRRTKIHPATRTFQALRIAVNDELDSLEALLDQAPELLNKNGILAVISFHSLEDRIVKLNFKKLKESGVYRIVTKKPLTPSQLEIDDNPRSRSSKLRIVQKI